MKSLGPHTCNTYVLLVLIITLFSSALPQSVEDSLFSRYQLSINNGDTAEAIDYLEKYLFINPDNRFVAARLGYLSLFYGDLNRSVKYLNEPATTNCKDIRVRIPCALF